MNDGGIDLHKKTIVLCVLDQHRRVVARRSLACCDTEGILAFLGGLRPFQAVVEATASYAWLVELIEPLADLVIPANPSKIYEIAPSAKKTDHRDAQVLAEKLAEGKVPRAHRPTPRRREHRTLVRHRPYLRQCATALKVEMRRIASDYNADRKDLFTIAGWEGLGKVKLRPSDRFVLDQLHAAWQHLEGQLRDLARRLKEFAATAPPREAEARAELRTVPGVGPVTIDVVVSERGDVGRFHSAKAVCASAGLVPGVRQSSDRREALPITKAGSPLLRWALVEAAWRAVRQGAARRRVYQDIRKRAGGKKAIVAVARRLLCVLYAMLRDGTHYTFLEVGEPPPA